MYRDPEFSMREQTPRRPDGGRRRISMRRHGARRVSVFVGAILIASCAKPYHEGNERYVFVATNIKLPYWQEAQAGFLDAANALGVRAELVGPETYDPGAEATMFRDLVEKQPSGICLSAARTDFFR